MEKNEEISIEDLASMVQKGFTDLSNKMDERFEQVDRRFEQVDKRIDKVDEKLGNVENKINQIDRRLFSIEEDIAEIKIKQYGDLNKRINFIERKLGIANAK